MTDQKETILDIVNKTRNLLAFHHDCGLEYPLEKDIVAPARKPATRDKAIARPTTPEHADHDEDSLAKIEKDVEACCKCSLEQPVKLKIQRVPESRQKLLIIIDPEKDPRQDEEFLTGESRELLSKMMAAINLDKDDFCLVPLVRCLPEKNHPTADQARSCLPFISRLLNEINPQIICCLGPLSSQTMLHSNKQLPSLRGRFHKWQDTPLIASYHPTLLRKHQELKKGSWHDLQLIQHHLRTSHP